MDKSRCSSVLLLFFGAFFCLNLTAQTTLKKEGDDWSLLVDGNPFDIKGVTFGYDKDVENYEKYFQDLRFLGVNTIRLWATNEHTGKLLDAAHNHGIKVMAGIWMRHGRPGMEDDDSFDYLKDVDGKETMYEDAIKTVKTFKNHPAVLTWGIGNEVYLNMDTDEEKVAYSKLLERICGKIKELDSNHPITSVEAWTFGLDWWQKYVPSIDIYGLNSYGPGASYLLDELQKKGIDKPYIITEFGVTGEWDVKQEKNGVKIEPGDKEKYDAIVTGYRQWIQNKPKCLGVYVFHYANGNDFISSWLLTHFNRMYRPQYWAIREAFTGKTPVNSVPGIKTFKLPDTAYESGEWAPVTLKVFDVENEDVEVSFGYNQRSGSRKRRNQVNPLDFQGNIGDGFEIKLPKEDGPIKVYVYAKDTYNNVGISSTSIIVIDEEAKNRKYLVPKVDFPFYVYQESGDMPYTPSGYMGNYTAIDVDLASKINPYSGNTCIKISYNAKGNWYGVGFVDPANDWGDILGGYDLTGAKTFSFWARTSESKLEATIGFGLIGSDKAFPDTAKKSVKIKLTPKWKKYTIKTKKLDLSCIRSGLVVVSSSNGFSHDIYLDDVIFE